MLSPALVLNYIKENVSFPFQVLEMKDDEILQYINNYVLIDFSSQLPDKNKMGVDLSLPQHATSIDNEYLLFEPDNRPIIGFVEVISDLGPSIISGHPLLGSSSFDNLPEFMLNTQQARSNAKWGFIPEPIFEFKEPNIIRCLPNYKGNLTIIYERVHSETYSTIPIWANSLFLKYCLGHIQILLGNKRKKFQTIQTPYGEVPLNADEIKSNGEDLVSKVEEKLNLYNPSIIIDIG